MQSLMRSMTPEQRAELQSMMDALLRDDRLLLDLAQLAANLDMLLPGGLGERVRFGGDEQLGLEGALDQLERLQRWTRSRTRSTDVEGPGRPRRDRPRRGPRPAGRRRGAGPRRARRPRAGRLEEAGYLERRRRPAGADAARHAPDRPARCSTSCSPACSATPSAATAWIGHGRGGEREETTKPYEFGDPFHLDLRGRWRTRSCATENAPAPAASRHRRASDPLDARRLRGLPDRAAHVGGDRPARRHEPLDAAARLLPGRQEGRHRARHAHPHAVPARPPARHRLRVLRPRDPAGGARRADLARLRVRHEPAARAAARAPDPRPRSAAANKEIVVITDGEPTAHFEDGQVEFSYPPTRRTIQETLREVAALHARGHHDQHVHARAVACAGRVRRAHDAAQPRPRLLRRRRSASASTSWSTSSAGGRSTSADRQRGRARALPRAR